MPQPTLGRGLHSVAKVAVVLLVGRRRPKQITVQKHALYELNTILKPDVCFTRLQSDKYTFS